MWNLNIAGTWNFNFDKVGRWWNNTDEIDIVAYDSIGNDIILGGCKYWKGKVGLDVLKSLEANKRNDLTLSS